MLKKDLSKALKHFQYRSFEKSNSFSLMFYMRLFRQIFGGLSKQVPIFQSSNITALRKLRRWLWKDCKRCMGSIYHAWALLIILFIFPIWFSSHFYLPINFHFEQFGRAFINPSNLICVMCSLGKITPSDLYWKSCLCMIRVGEMGANFRLTGLIITFLTAVCLGKWPQRAFQ